MFQVTAIAFHDCEIGYGEGETESYARQECLESIDSVYRELSLSEIEFQVVRS